MSKYVEVQEFLHEGGTKDYHFIMLVDEDGECVMVKRWGKVGSSGQAKIEKFNHSYGLRTALDKEKVRRAKKDYRFNAKVKAETIEGWNDALSNMPRAISNKAWMDNPEIATLVYGWLGGAESVPDKSAAPAFDPESDEVDRGDLWGSW